MFVRLLSTVILLSAFVAPAWSEPKLVITLVVDQLRPERLSEDMPGGLGRLMREGRVYSEATLDHGLTNTCPGHVVISTGVYPGKAGIPGNSYIDHETMEERYCVDDDDDQHRVYGADINRSPAALRVTALGDWLKQSSPASKVFSVSGKDRAAITMGGQNPDGAYWYDRNAAGFTTSGYYGEMPGYLLAFNNGDFFRKGYGASVPAVWEHPPGGKRKDDYPGESEANSRTSGHPVNQGDTSERAYRFYGSPFLDTATAELAKRVIVEEKLGQRGVTDLLSISLSSTDIVGHIYGPFSAESADAIRRLDEDLGGLLAMLDDLLEGDYVVALTADHGVLPLPEWMVETGEMTCSIDGGRIPLQQEALGMYAFLYKEFTFPLDNPQELVGFSSAGVVVNEAMAIEVGSSLNAVVAAIEEYQESRSHVVEAWTPAEIMDTDDPFGRLYRNSYVPGKSGHLMLQFEETCLAGRPHGTSHGTPYLYDRRVPMIFFGEDVVRARSLEEKHSVDIAPTLADYLGLEVPDNLDGEVLGVFE